MKLSFTALVLSFTFLCVETVSADCIKTEESIEYCPGVAFVQHHFHCEGGAWSWFQGLEEAIEQCRSVTSKDTSTSISDIIVKSTELTRTLDGKSVDVSRNDVINECYSDRQHSLRIPAAHCEFFPTILESATSDLIVRYVDKDLVLSQIVEMYKRCGLAVDVRAIEGYWYARMLDSYGNNFLNARHWTNYYISRYSSNPNACLIY